jgi:hypothetical protein
MIVVGNRIARRRRLIGVLHGFALSLMITQSVAEAQAVAHPSNPAHEATLSALSGTLEVLSSPRHQARINDTLAEGTRLRLNEDSTATLTMHGGAVVALSDRAELFLYGDPSVHLPAGQTPTFDTVLRRGSYRVTVGPTAHAVAFATPACTVTVLQGGEVMLRTDARRTRLVVLHGRARIRAMGREVLAREGMGAKVELAQQAMPHPLVAAPTITAIRSESYTFGGTVDTPIAWAPAGRTPAQRWRVQVARDAGFVSQLREQIVTSNRATLSDLTAGNYFVRVSGIDADDLDGAWSAPSSFRVEGPVIHPAQIGHSVAMLTVPAGLPCGLDTSPLRVQSAPIELTPGRNHVLRCDRGEAGGGIAQMQISAEQAGPLQHQVRITPDATSDVHSITIRLTDARGYGIPYATLVVQAPAGVRVDPITEGTERGTYIGTVRWPAAVGRGAVRITVNGAVSFEESIAP